MSINRRAKTIHYTRLVFEKENFHQNILLESSITIPFSVLMAKPKDNEEPWRHLVLLWNAPHTQPREYHENGLDAHLAYTAANR